MICQTPAYAYVPSLSHTERVECQLERGHEQPKAHHGLDSTDHEWVWWTYGADTEITRPCRRPVLPDAKPPEPEE